MKGTGIKKSKRIEKNTSKNSRGFQAILKEIRNEFKIPDNTTDEELIQKLNDLHSIASDNYLDAICDFKILTMRMNEKGYFSAAMSKLNVW